jgi:hypothetical protein
MQSLKLKAMKKSIVIFIMLFTAAALQAQSLKKTEKINSDQVPVIVREAFETDFGKIPEAGFWTATFIVDRAGARPTAKPLSYTFHKRSKTEKVEIRYTAEGKLDFAKGLEKKNSNT